MKEDLLKLKDMQELDNGIRAGEEQIARLRAKAGELSEELRDFKQSVGKQGEEARAAKLHMKSKEAELEAAEADVKKLESQLNAATSNKEFAAIRHQRERVKERISAIEDDLLKIMDKIEGGDDRLEGLKQEVAAREGDAEDKKRDIGEKVEGIKAHSEELRRKRKALAETLPRRMLEMYERIHKGRPDGKGVAPVRNFTCMGCQMTLPPNVVNNLMKGVEIQTCQSCSRILYLDTS